MISSHGLVLLVGFSVILTASGLSPPRPRLDEEQQQEKKQSVLFVTTGIPPVNYHPAVGETMRDRPLSELYLQVIGEAADSAVSDFQQRLLLEEEASNPPISKEDVLYWNSDFQFLVQIAAAGGLLILASNFIAPGKAMLFLEDVSRMGALGGMLYFPFAWIRPGSIKEDLLTFAKFFGRFDFVLFLNKASGSKILTTLRQMIVAEIWILGWKVVFAKVDALLKRFWPRGDDIKQPPSPKWLADTYAFLSTSVSKGCRNLFKKVMRKHVEDSIGTLAMFATEAMSEYFFPRERQPQ